MAPVRWPMAARLLTPLRPASVHSMLGIVGLGETSRGLPAGAHARTHLRRGGWQTPGRCGKRQQSGHWPAVSGHQEPMLPLWANQEPPLPQRATCQRP
ncbi:hypothetical protein F5Y07DRAFT_379992 [Xylaria sp. FL0933]|nr:hypothetical protein F5Y07DRAFT_379992 [Xylaria sp. FL0933]